MNIFDSHAHYLSEAFDEDRHEILRELLNGPVCGIIEAGTTADSSAEAVKLAREFPAVWTAVGIHPQEAATATKEDLTAIEVLTADNKVIAIGEIGLDYHYEDACLRDVQQQWFHHQLELAKDKNLPVVIHDRDAHEDTLRILQHYRPAGVVHCFSGSAEMAKEIIKLGMYIGIGGVLTFKNARKLVEVASQVPLDRFLLETDAPYLAPVPLRGHRCDSSMIAHTAAVMATLRGTDTQRIIDLATENTKRLYNIG